MKWVYVVVWLIAMMTIGSAISQLQQQVGMQVGMPMIHGGVQP